MSTAKDATEGLLSARFHLKAMYDIARPFRTEEEEGRFCIEMAHVIGLLQGVELDLFELGAYEPEETGDATEGGG